MSTTTVKCSYCDTTVSLVVAAKGWVCGCKESRKAGTPVQNVAETVFQEPPSDPKYDIYKTWCWRDKPLSACSIDELLDAHAHLVVERFQIMPLGPLEAVRDEIKRRVEG